MGINANSRIRSLEHKIEVLTRRLNFDSVPDPNWSPGDLPAKAQSTKPKPIPPPEPAKPKPSAPSNFKPQNKPEPVMAAATAAPPQRSHDKPRPSPIKSPKPPKPKRRSFEEELGARWAVWVGGIALLFGAVFLLRYSIESGFFTPAMRIAMASVLGAALLAGGEWLRRQDGRAVGAKLAKGALKDSPLAGRVFENSYIPGVLTGVGIFTLLGTIFAAYSLYDYIGAVPAFILMGIVSLGALALGLLHGPWISALGLVASFATPLLIQTETPNVHALFGYLTIISLAGWALARIRQWGWLDIATLGGGLFWLAMSLKAAKAPDTYGVWLAFLAFSLVAGNFIASKAEKRQPGKPKPADLAALKHGPATALIWTAVAAILLLKSLAFSKMSFQTETIIGLGFVGALAAFVIKAPRLIGNLWPASLFAFFLTAFEFAKDKPRTGGEILPAIMFAALIGGSIFWALYRSKETEYSKPLVLTSALLGALSPSLIVWAQDMDHFKGETNFTAAAVMICAAACLWAALKFREARFDERETPNTINAVYALGAAFAYWMSIIIWGKGLEESIGLIMGIVVFALIYGRFKWEILRWIAFGFAAIAAVQILYVEIPIASRVSDSPFFNELWFYFALPSVVCFGAARGLEFTRRDLPSEGLKAFGLAFAALFIVFQIRHFSNDGQILSPSFGFDEIALQVAAGLCFTLGGAWLKLPEVRLSADPKKPFPLAQNLIPGILTLVSYVTLAIFVVGLCFAMAPLLNPDTIISGGPVLNSLIIAYLVPGILMAAILFLVRDKRSKTYSRILSGTISLALVFYVTSQIRRLYSGDMISILRDFPEGLETYTISASWLLIGILLLVVGLKRDVKSLRAASALMITLATLKAFLIDMATLEGVLRAVSFVILGLVLIVIGRVYQRILFDAETRKSAVS